jgi:hypothetical protein
MKSREEREKAHNLFGDVEVEDEPQQDDDILLGVDTVCNCFFGFLYFIQDFRASMMSKRCELHSALPSFKRGKPILLTLLRLFLSFQSFFPLLTVLSELVVH